MLVMHRYSAVFEELLVLPLQISLEKVTFLVLNPRINIVATHLHNMRCFQQ